MTQSIVITNNNAFVNTFDTTLIFHILPKSLPMQCYPVVSIFIMSGNSFLHSHRHAMSILVAVTISLYSLVVISIRKKTYENVCSYSKHACSKNSLLCFLSHDIFIGTLYLLFSDCIQTLFMFYFLKDSARLGSIILISYYVYFFLATVKKLPISFPLFCVKRMFYGVRISTHTHYPPYAKNLCLEKKRIKTFCHRTFERLRMDPLIAFIQLL